MNFQHKNNGFYDFRVTKLMEGVYNTPGPDVSGLQAGFKNIARVQLEFWALSSRRSRAALSFPTKLAQCTTPQAAMAAYAEFWTGAFADCADSTRRINEALIASPVEEIEPTPVATVPVVRSEKSAKVAGGRRRQALNGAAPLESGDRAY